MQKGNKPIFRYLLPVLVFMSCRFAYGQNNVPNTVQQTVTGSINNYVPIPASTIPWGVQTLTVLAPKYRDTSSVLFSYSTTADKAAMTATALSGQGNSIQIGIRRGNNSFIIKSTDIRNLPDVYSFQAYPSSAGYDINPINRSTQYHNNSLYPSEGGAEVSTAGLSASMTRNTSTNDERSSTVYTAGRSRIGQGRGTKTTLIFNDENTGSGLPQAGIRIWNIGSNGLPQANGYFAANALNGSLVTTPQGGQKLMLEDRNGSPVYEAVLVNRNPMTYAKTYYVYDEMGRLRYVMPPKAVEALEAASGVVNQAVVDELCFSYKYDAKGRQYAQHKPGEQGGMEVVYNNQGQIIMRRNVIEQSKGLWEVLFYDLPGRVIATAILTNNQSRDDWQTLANAETSGGVNTVNHYLWGNGRYTYPTLTSITSCEIQSFNYYDGYETTHPLAAENFSTDLIQSNLSTAINAEPYITGGSTYGLQTSGSVRVLKAHASLTNLQDWTYSKNFYDKERRPIYTVSQHSRGGKDTSLVQYNYSGEILVTAHGHRYGNGTGPAFREWYRNTYDAQTGELTLSEHKLSNTTWQIMKSNTYDPLGRIASTTYGANAETQNFSYNIRGELQGINENYAITGENSGQSITFGEALRYDYGYDSLRYDGLAAGMIWRGSGGGNLGAHSYGYIYDAAGRMLRGAYSRSNPGYTAASGWGSTNQDYSETVTYDQAGNILTLKRLSVVAANQMVYATTIDNLTYTYLTNSNKLDKVVDAITTDYGRGDFQNRKSQGYTYDAAGNLTKDRSKGIFSSPIAYTYFNKPVTIFDSTGARLYYSYDAAGNKVQELVNIGTQVRNDYIGTAIYKDNVLQSITTPVGRTDMTKSIPQEQYFVKDHLGNVRSVVADAVTTGGIGTVAATSKTYNATYETSNLSQEELTFEQVAMLSEDKPANTNKDDYKAAMLSTAKSGNPNVGTTLLLKVMAGDKLSLNADNYYESDEPLTGNKVSGSNFEQIVNSLAQAAGQMSSVEGGIANDWAARMLNSNSLKAAYEALEAGTTDPGRPKAYLNYLFFDEQMQLLPEYSHIWQADGAGNWSRIGTNENETIEVPQNGYMATYISTQSAEPTYFDNLSVTVEPGVLLEEKHYYPYGLPYIGFGTTASGVLPNKSRYQGNEYREEAFLNWMDFHNRQYDPQLGRFLSVDPMADAEGQQGMSPYHAMACNPSTVVDPLGLFGHQDAVHAGMFTKMAGQRPPSRYEMLLMMSPSQIFDAMFGVFYYADQKMEEVLSGLHADIFANEAHDRAVASKYNEILSQIESGAIASTLATDFGSSFNPQSTFAWYTGENDGSDKDNLYTIYRIPGLSDEKVKALAKQAGGQGLGGLQCNAYSAYFIELLLNYLENKADDPNRGFSFFESENILVKQAAALTAKYLKNIGFSRLAIEGMPTEMDYANALNKGYPVYANSFAADGTNNGHRIVIFEMGIHKTNQFANYIKYYDPNRSGIQTMFNFFYQNKGDYKQGFYNYPYWHTTFSITGRK